MSIHRFFSLLIPKQRALTSALMLDATDGAARIFANHLMKRRDSNPHQLSFTRLGPLKVALPTEPQHVNAFNGNSGLLVELLHA